ncbi:hypothetical protein M885DRAFT_546070 [Pelagophyceae sp. CCMP2097]|nr:hypothetical protein M885DRAFT_546070 [Pelagophyceae sp. CCMP2097]|mmetsp:Transcript_32472/g.109431  ORF Transcript_32472/g.109431 Transcript_32472/m.109431 type:complete len:205 (-) Transcript_32472:203-817(-)
MDDEYSDDDQGGGEAWDDGEEEAFRQALALNAQLKQQMGDSLGRHAEASQPQYDEPRRAAMPQASSQPQSQKEQQRRKDFAAAEKERFRIEQANTHIERHLKDISKRNAKAGGFSHNAAFFDQSGMKHVSASEIQRRRQGSKITAENRLIANRLEQIGDGAGIRSSGYARARINSGVGPLAKKNVEQARARRQRSRLEQPEMTF